MESWRPYIAMIVIQLLYGGSNIIIKLGLQSGLNQLVLVAYRHLIAMFLFAPFAYLFERKELRPLSVSVMLKIFVLSSLGTTIHLNVFFAGLHYVSPTVASALTNVVPSLTFLTAVILRMEQVKIGNGRGQAKVVGTVICIGGALIFTFWKGPFLHKPFLEKPLINIHTNEFKQYHTENWIKGSLLIILSHIAWSSWLILQAVVTKVYPTPLSLNVLICLFATLQSFSLAPFFARNLSLWKLQWNVQLLTIVYCGVVNSAIVYFLQTWCISVKGPVFAAMFVPLTLVFVAIFSAIAFAEQLHLGRDGAKARNTKRQNQRTLRIDLPSTTQHYIPKLQVENSKRTGSLVGAFLIIVGLYCVLWGKKSDTGQSGIRDTKAISDDSNLSVQQSAFCPPVDVT